MRVQRGAGRQIDDVRAAVRARLTHSGGQGPDEWLPVGLPAAFGGLSDPPPPARAAGAAASASTRIATSVASRRRIKSLKPAREPKAALDGNPTRV